MPGAQKLQPPLAQDRLRRTPDGEVWLALRHRWADKTTHLRFDPVELLERLAVLTPRPRINLILYYGVLAPRAAWRAEVVAYRSRRDGGGPATSPGEAALVSRPGASVWAELMKRTFGFDVLVCPRCGGRLRLVSLIMQEQVIQRILRHLGPPADPPVPWPARSPPADLELPDRDWLEASDAAGGGVAGPAFEPCS